jgi:hypothetical protein
MQKGRNHTSKQQNNNIQSKNVIDPLLNRAHFHIVLTKIHNQLALHACVHDHTKHAAGVLNNSTPMEELIDAQVENLILLQRSLVSLVVL